MQTIASLAERLDMTAEEAVEKLRFMMFEIEGVDSVISDDEIDLLIDVDDDPSVAERTREAKLKEIEKAKKRTERLKQAAKKAAAKRKAAAAKKKASASKAKAKTKAKAKAKAKTKAKAKVEGSAEEPEAAEAEEAKAELLVEASGEPEEAAVIEAVEEPKTAAKPAKKPKAEILPPKPPEEEAEAEEGEGPGFTIGHAIEHDAHSVEVVRADGTHLTNVPEVEIPESEAADEVVEEEEEEHGLLAEAERRQEEEERRKAKVAAARPLPKPDPAVVAEVIRRASERARKAQAAPRGAVGKTGKTARKRQKKAEKVRQEQEMRKQAAAAVRSFQADGSPGLGAKRRKRRRRDDDSAAIAEDFVQPKVIEVEESMTVEELAGAMEMGVNDLILELMEFDILASKNQTLDIEMIRKITEDTEFEIRAVIPQEAELYAEEPDDPAELLPRAPVVTVMGHVDHGKTTLLDRVRSAHVAEGEAGGITQHIAAYEARVGDGRVVFLDTPGHEAFTQMRARGASVTDVVVLVVAADDGVMPQTLEAIDHAKAAEVPIVVAVNKCDKPDAQPDRIRQELAQHDLLDEKWGGKTVMRDISAKMGEGVDELMELLVLETEMLELKASPNKRARGAVLEAELNRSMGPVAWLLVQAGTLHVGDVVLAGSAYGRVRAMQNSRGDNVEEAGPATPVAVTGLNSLPDAGDVFVAVPDERVARAVATQREQLARRKQGPAVRHITLEDFHERMLAGEKRELNVVLKADVQGSVDVLESSLAKVGNEEVHVSLVHTGVGSINESDVLLASASDAVVIGFHVTANAKVQKMAEQEGVDIHTYRVIYEAIEDVRKALEGLLAPEKREVVTGHVEIREVFRSSALGNIAGCYVQDGEVNRASLIRVVRDGVVVYEGKIQSLRRGREDVRDVQSGFECGIKVEKFEDIKVGDILEAYRVDSVAKTLA